MLKKGTAGECHSTPGSSLDELCESPRPQEMHHDQAECCKAGHLAEDWEKGGEFKVEWQKVTLKTNCWLW